MLQECLAHWWVRRRRYDPARGASPRTFMRQVLRAKLVDIEDWETAEKRGGYERPLSIDAPLSNADGDDLLLSDALADLSHEHDPESALERRLLQEHMEGVATLLSQRQRELFEGLQCGWSMSELSDRMGEARPTLYDELRRIQAIFRRQGLEDFPPLRPDTFGGFSV